MLKNISNNVKCVKVQYAKILLSSAFLFALFIWIVMNLGTCQWGQINSPILYKVPLFKSQMIKHNTLEFKLLWQIKKR